jgi:hypothetical protein
VRVLKTGLAIAVASCIVAGCGSHATTPASAGTLVSTPIASPAATLPTGTPADTPVPSPIYPWPDAEIKVGRHYSYSPGALSHDQATVESLDVSAYRGKLLAIRTDTSDYKIRLGIYGDRIDLNRWWGDSAPFVYETEFEADASARIFIYPSMSTLSIVYITRPIEFKTPEYMKLERELSIETPPIPIDTSRPFITEYWTFPQETLAALNDPAQFTENMNREYEALRELLGREPEALDRDGHIRLAVKDIPACGWAGNPIFMAPVCMDPALLNTGNPGWGPAHELGHDYVGPYSYCWDEPDSNEGWANFMAFYAFDRGVFINSDYDAAFWDKVWDTSTKPTDIFQGAIVKTSRQYGWDVAKTFFHKYLAADPAKGKTATVMKKQAVRYLAEAAREVTGRQSAYDDVVAYLVARGFPQP